MSPRHSLHPLHLMLSCLFGLLLLVMAWPRAVHSADLSHAASMTHAVVVMHDGTQGNTDDDVNASLVLEDNGGMDDLLHLPANLDLGLIPTGSAVLTAGPYALRQRDIALLLRPPEAA